MKIFVQSAETHFKCWIPNSLIFSGLVRKSIVSQIYKTSGEKIPFPPAVMNELFAHLKEIAAEYKGLNLVEVKSSDGTEVLIQL